jgi:hypothetical protein
VWYVACFELFLLVPALLAAVGMNWKNNNLLFRRVLSSSLGLLLLTVASGSAQSQTLLSQTTWGGAGTDASNGVAVAADGSAYVVGLTDSFTTDQFGQPSAAIFLVKFASDGSLASQRIWNGSTFFGSFQGPGVALGAGGSVYVAGATGTNGGDAVLLKFDASGNLIWQRTWGGSQFDVANAVATTSDGSAFIVGTTTSFGASGRSLFVVKFDASGNLVWQKISDGSEGMAVAVAPDGSVYAAGTTPRPTVIGTFDLIALKITSDGALTWQRTYSAGNVVDPRGGMTVASDGSIYVAGAIQAPQGGRSGFVDIAALVIKLGPDGSLVFDREWGGSNGETAAGVAVAPDGTVYIAGTSSSFGAGIDDAFVLHLSPTGKPADAMTWGGTGIDNGTGVAVATDGTILLAATASSPPYSFLGAPRKTSMIKGTLTVPTKTLDDVSGTVSDPGAAVTTPNGTTTFGGSVDAALVRIAQ